MNNFDTISILLTVFGLVISIASIAHSIFQYKLDFPELPFKYGTFKGYKVKTKKVNIVIIRNGNAGYTRQIRNGFIHQAITVFSKTHVALQFEDFEGKPNKEGDNDNKMLIQKVMEEFHPDILVTIGTQVSVSARTHFADRMPIIAIGVAAPIRSNLIDARDLKSIDSLNLAVVRYGIRIEDRIDFLSKLFKKSKKSIKYIFIANPDVLQDSLLLTEVKEISSKRKDIDIEVLETKDSTLPEEYDCINNIFFGFYHLNRHLTTYINNAKNAIFLGLNPTDTCIGTIASTGNNDYHLGKISVDRILVPKIIKRRSLADIELLEPKPYYSLNKKIAFRKNLEFSDYATKTASEIIDY